MEMKKYMTPEMEVIEIKAQNALLAISGNGGGSEPDPNQDPTPIGGDL
jgi:hypothetical protein